MSKARLDKLEARVSALGKGSPNGGLMEDVKEDVSILRSIQKSFSSNGVLSSTDLREVEDMEKFYFSTEKGVSKAPSQLTASSDRTTGPNKGSPGAYGWKVCSHFGEVAFQLPVKGGLIHLAGARGADVSVYDADVVFDLAGLVKPSAAAFVTGAERFQVLNKYTRTGELVRLHWTDMGIPPVGLAFWKAILGMLKPGQKVIFACAGSHGRTGTALAAMLMVHDSKLTARQAIAMVRKHHCPDAIETLGQEGYLAALANARDPKGK